MNIIKNSNELMAIMLRRKNSLFLYEPEKNICIDELDSILEFNEYKEKLQLITTLIQNINGLGYTLSNNLMIKLLNYEYDFLKEKLNWLYNQLRSLTGADKEYIPMYKNFPDEVMALSEFALYFNALVHYISEGTWYPESSPEQKTPFCENVNLTLINGCDEKDVIELMKNILASKTSISEQDKEDIITIFESFEKDLDRYVPTEIPFKENSAFVTSYFWNNYKGNENIIISILRKTLSTPTDVLRFITLLSNGDVTLSTNTRFMNFSRKERRIILGILNNMSSLEENLLKYRNKWLRIAEIIHPEDYSKHFPSIANAFKKLRENPNLIMTFNKQVEKALFKRQVSLACDLLKARPGEFARRLDYLLRESHNNEETLEILNTFKSVANNVSTTILYQLIEYFKHRNDENKIRTVMLKGNTTTPYKIEKELPSQNREVCQLLVMICENAIKANYTSRPLMGKVYLDEDLKNYTIPFSQRTASSAKNIITRGSRIKLNNDTNYIRPFIWWTNNIDDEDYDERIDVDLSCSLLDENYKVLTNCSFRELKNTKYDLYHSGDIINGGPVDGKGVAEFIDINLDILSQNNVRYVAIGVFNYSQINYINMNNCDFGFMEIETNNSGEIFEPSTVTNRMKLTANSNYCTPVVLDVKNREFVWLDMSGTCNGGYANALEENLKGTTLALYSILNSNRPNMYDLINNNISVRGIRTGNPLEADIIYTSAKNLADDLKEQGKLKENVKIITPYDIDEFYALL